MGIRSKYVSDKATQWKNQKTDPHACLQRVSGYFQQLFFNITISFVSFEKPLNTLYIAGNRKHLSLQ